MEEIRVKETRRSSTTLTAEEQVARILHDTTLPVREKSRLVYETTSQIIDDLFKQTVTPQKIVQTKQTVSRLLDGVIHDEITIASLLQVSSYDYYTYTHCVNVSVYAVGLGKEMGLKRNELLRLGCGGILHDLGKSKVDHDLINKPGRLSDEEFMIVKNHPALGYDLLKEMHESDAMILSIVRHHHEKLDGTGYPDGLKGEEVDFYARIVAISDIFDALTTRRSYKPALSTFEALGLMKNKMATELDTVLLKHFIQMMGKH